MKLEKEFEEMTANTRKEIKDKMETIALLLKEAEDLCDKHGICLTDYSFYDEVYPMFKAMRDIGWSTSSLSC